MMTALYDGTNARTMWVVLHERENPQAGYVIAYDDDNVDSPWILVEGAWGLWQQVTAADSLEDALRHM